MNRYGKCDRQIAVLISKTAKHNTPQQIASTRSSLSHYRRARTSMLYRNSPEIQIVSVISLYPHKADRWAAVQWIYFFSAGVYIWAMEVTRRPCMAAL